MIRATAGTIALLCSVACTQAAFGTQWETTEERDHRLRCNAARPALAGTWHAILGLQRGDRFEPFTELKIEIDGEIAEASVRPPGHGPWRLRKRLLVMPDPAGDSTYTFLPIGDKVGPEDFRMYFRRLSNTHGAALMLDLTVPNDSPAYGPTAWPETQSGLMIQAGARHPGLFGEWFNDCILLGPRKPPQTMPR